MKLYAPTNWPAYELLDTGNFEKLERFGEYVTRRPEPQAVWSPYLSEDEWNKADATYLPDGSHKGNWKRNPKMPDQWYLPYKQKSLLNQDLHCKLPLILLLLFLEAFIRNSLRISSQAIGRTCANYFSFFAAHKTTPTQQALCYCTKVQICR